MSDLPANEPNEGDERPGLLSRIRPVAKVVFGVLIVSTVVGVAQGLWEVIADVWSQISPP